MQRRAIAVVDDDLAFRDMMADVLTNEGYVPLLCPEPLNPLNWIRDQLPDLVLLDLWLSRPADGLHLLEQLRSGSATAHIPVIVTSANQPLLQTEEARLQELAAGIVPKPFDIDEMAMTIQAVISQDGHASARL